MVGGKFTLIIFIMIQKKKIKKLTKLFNLMFIYNINLVLMHMMEININDM